MWLPLAAVLVTLFDLIIGTSVNSNYITYHPGTLPIILGAPHGGSIKPEEVQDRDAGCWDGEQCVWSHNCGDEDSSKCKATTGADLYTKELTLLLRDELKNLYGDYPHAVVCELHRSKMDANRDMATASFGVSIMEKAWTQFHTYINQSKAESFPQASLYIDIHGHGHALQRAELGYLIKGSQLNSNDFTPEGTSIRRLAENVGITFEQLLRGKQSFGGILENEGYEAVPSFNIPRPNDDPFFSGGDNTRMHGSRSGGHTDAIQIESPSSFRSAEKRADYAKALARTVKKFMQLHFGFTGNDNKNTTPQDEDIRDMSTANRISPCIAFSIFIAIYYSLA